MKRSALTQLPNALRMSPSGDAVGGAVLPGYSALPSTFTLNSVTPTPTFIFRGNQATTSNWPDSLGGNTMPLVGTGPLPTVGVASPFPNPGDTVVEFSGANPGQTYAATSTSFGDLTTEDFVFEALLMTPGSLASGIVCKKTSSATGNNGWRLSAVQSPFRTIFLVRSGSTITAQNAGTLYTSGQWAHFMVFADRSGNIRTYLDGVLILTTDISPLVGLSLAGADTLTLGTFTGSTAAGPISLGWAALWEASNLCSGATADQDALALSRFLATGL